MRSAVRNRTAGFLPKPLDSVAYTGLNLVGPIFLPEIDRMSPLDCVTNIPQSVPVLVMAGGRDDRALPDEVKAIYERVASHARFILFPEAKHGQFAAQGEKYHKAIVEFLHEKQ